MKLKETRLLNLKELLLGAKYESIQSEKPSFHPSEIAEAINSIPDVNQVKAFQVVNKSIWINVFEYLSFQTQQNILSQLSDEDITIILTKMSPDDRTVLFSQLSGLELTKYMNLLHGEDKAEAHNLLGYAENSIGRLMNTDFFSFKHEITIAKAIEQIRAEGKDNETLNMIYLTDAEGKLIDDIPLRRLLLYSPDKMMSEIMDHSFIRLHVNDKNEEAIKIFKEYDRVALPVVNDENILLGIVTIDDVLDVVEESDTQDIQKFGGVDSLDMPYAKTPLFELVKKRAGWLVILFLSEMLTATAMGFFEDEIAKAVVLALFIPLIISSGGNSGSQAATLIIRAMALREITLKDWWKVMRKEIFSGLMLGGVLGTIGFLRILIWQNLHLYNYGDHWFLIGLTISFTLVGIVMWGTISGSMIPFALKRFKLDPATSSAPFVATLVDVTGLIIYFTVASVILKGTLL